MMATPPAKERVMQLRDPKVIKPEDFDCAAAWKECGAYVEKCGGMQHKDGEPNWRAAAGADPGVCSCPSCGAYYWCWGRVVECLDCKFQFPTDWWPMYSYGVQAANRGSTYKHDSRMRHSYYRYGYEHPVEDPWDEHDKIDWPVVLVASEDTNG